VQQTAMCEATAFTYPGELLRHRHEVHSMHGRRSSSSGPLSNVSHMFKTATAPRSARAYSSIYTNYTSGKTWTVQKLQRKTHFHLYSLRPTTTLTTKTE